jgi:peptide deformylase
MVKCHHKNCNREADYRVNIRFMGTFGYCKQHLIDMMQKGLVYIDRIVPHVAYYMMTPQERTIYDTMYYSDYVDNMSKK